MIWLKKKFVVLFPATEHAPFDLVAYQDNRFIRIQVKYRRAVNGSIQIPMKSWWADINGCHGKQIDKAQIDVFAFIVLILTSVITSNQKMSESVLIFVSQNLKTIRQKELTLLKITQRHRRDYTHSD